MMKKYNIPKRGERMDWQTIVLMTVRTVGVVSVAVLAPNALKMFKILDKKNSKKQNIKRATSSLEKRGLLKKDKKGIYSLTPKGERELWSFEFQMNQSKRQKWDGKWRVVIFDIEERRRGVRDRVREYLQNVGFVMVQQSVWVYPYRCDKAIDLLRTEFNLDKNMLYIVASTLGESESKKLRNIFNLTK